ncbi:DNA polymerase III subunit delta, partial [Candidatus Pelagibacter sp.]|nr:DNA polymerase III subunit delta [Candidatus Pelagibacter sp.]
SPLNINLIVNKCNGDRQNLINEVKKIENYSKNGKSLTAEVITKLTNLSENHGVSELIDNCLAKNKKKIIHILNENNFSNEDCVLITRTFLSKSKKVLMLAQEYKLNKNIDQTISTARPPIFWKDKEITKEQIYKWTPENLKELIYKLSELELLVKKNISNSVNLITDFILKQVTT